MRTDPPTAEPNKRYTITQTAVELETSVRTIQRYIAAGIMRAEIRKSTKKRFVLGQEIIKVWNETI
jgi:hypothetical protein